MKLKTKQIDAIIDSILESAQIIDARTDSPFADINPKDRLNMHELIKTTYEIANEWEGSEDIDEKSNTELLASAMQAAKEAYHKYFESQQLTSTLSFPL